MVSANLSCKVLSMFSSQQSGVIVFEMNLEELINQF